MKREIIITRFNYVIEYINEYDDLSYAFNENGKDIEVIDFKNDKRVIINLAYNGRCWVNYCNRKMSVFNGGSCEKSK